MGKVNLEPKYLVWPITKDSGNQTSRQILVADAKRAKTCASES